MVGGIPEVVAHDETGLLVPVAQQVKPICPTLPKNLRQGPRPTSELTDGRPRETTLR